ALVENVAVQLGMPVGPLAVLDEVSLKLADDVLHQEMDDARRQHADRHDGHAHDHGHVHGHAHDHDHAHDGVHAHRHDHALDRKAGRIPESAVYVLEKMAHGYRRMGRAYGGGFYD